MFGSTTAGVAVAAFGAAKVSGAAFDSIFSSM
jgi:hypothetical protein